jgi:L-rhamnose isomerase
MFTAPSEDMILQNYENAKKVYAGLGIDTDKALDEFSRVGISIHSWAGDDVTGFEKHDNVHSENTVTGNYPGRARNGDELRQDLAQAMRFSPCRHRLGLQSMHAEPADPRKERRDYGVEDFRKWIDFAKARGMAIDFNVSYFTHPMMKDGCSLASPDDEVRNYWVAAGINGRRICEAIGRELGCTVFNNTWTPDGVKDNTTDRMGYRMRLRDSLDRIYAEKLDERYLCDCLEGKVFSIANECFTVGSHDFYIAYAAKNNVGLTIDTGHFHPTENYADKISAVYPFVNGMMFHLSRGVRWDSDHTLTQEDPLLLQIFQELKRADLLDKRVGIGLDFFDAQVNRVTAWIVGLRAAGKSLLTALLEPTEQMQKAEYAGNLGLRMAMLDECRNLPVNAVWDYLCFKKNAGVGMSWLDDMDRYEHEVQFKRV